MSHFPFYNRYPYTNFEQLNLDYILNETAKFSRRVEELEKTVTDHEGRITTIEGDITTIEADIIEIKSDIVYLETRMTSAESSITDHEERITLNTNDISGLKTRMTTAESDISSNTDAIAGLDIRVTNNTDRINVVETENAAQDNQILQLAGRVTDLESHSVVANPGGTGANLNTLGVDGVTYVIPSGGGGGGGSTVTPNPAGVVSTDPELSALGIDALNYRIPVTSADKQAIENSISDIDDRVDTLEDAITQIDTRIGTVIQRSTNDQRIINALMSDPDAVIELDGTQRVPSGVTAFDSTITLAPGVYLLQLSCEIDTTTYGSTPRFLGCYIRNASNVNLARGKFSVFGTERAMITQAAALNCQKVVTVPEGETLVIHAAVRCNGGMPSPTAPKQFTLNNLEFDAIKMGVIS